MRIQVNGETRELASEYSLKDLLVDLSVSHDRVAIELNQKVVRRAEWEAVNLRDGDKLEIVHFVGGGAGSADRIHPVREGLACKTRSDRQLE